MKKEILAAAAVSGSLLMISGAWAQTCVTPPSCEELGYTKSASDCEGMESLLCPFDKSKYYCVDVAGSLANAAPGMILYSDGTVSENVVSGKTPVGIVAYVAGSTRLAVALEETTKSWGADDHDVWCVGNMVSSVTQFDFNGALNTQCLINDNIPHPAAEYCNTYKPVSSGTGASGWYLPAAGELVMMSFNFEAINSTLQRLSKTQLSSDIYNPYYWSSSEYDYGDYAWVVRPSDSSMSHDDNENSSNRVRCVLAF